MIVCKECGYTEREYDEENSVEFNIKMAKFLHSSGKAMKGSTPNLPNKKR